MLNFGSIGWYSAIDSVDETVKDSGKFDLLFVESKAWVEMPNLHLLGRK